MKYGGHRLREKICNLNDRVVQCSKTPKEWKISHISPIYKKGDKQEPKNYRGISVNDTLNRLFSKIIQKKLQENFIEKLDKNQSGFLPGISCVYDLFTILQLIYKHKRESFLAFLI
jgi:Reverse transcriptase (RNA-dependent DNA polymerase).